MLRYCLIFFAFLFITVPARSHSVENKGEEGRAGTIIPQDTTGSTNRIKGSTQKQQEKVLQGAESTVKDNIKKVPSAKNQLIPRKIGTPKINIQTPKVKVQPVRIKVNTKVKVKL